MKVKELIDILKQYPEDSNVILSHEYGDYLVDEYEYVPINSCKLVNNNLYIEIDEL